MRPLTSGFISQMFVDVESEIKWEVELDKMSLGSGSSGIGLVETVNCSFGSKRTVSAKTRFHAQIPFHIIRIASERCVLDGCCLADVALSVAALCVASLNPFVASSVCSATWKPVMRSLMLQEVEESLRIICNWRMSPPQKATFFTIVFGWNGSAASFLNSSVAMKDKIISNSKKGALFLSGGIVEIFDGKFENNNPSIANYGSVRWNVLCGDSAKLKVTSLKGGDGLEKNTSLWILDEGCTLEGITKERASAFFIPKVESVTSEKSGEKVDVVFRGSVLLPCNLSFKTVTAIGDEEVIEKHLFDERDFISEEEVHGSVPVKTIECVPSEAEVRVCILFGKADSPSATNSFILKNRRKPESNGDERKTEGGKERKSSFVLIIIVLLVVILLFVIIVSIALIVRWRKQKRRAEEEIRKRGREC
ncbi:uncharacterized protein MONOS_15184 [Monocercomonoides exilis]|uniref:uncharacterized protein n=1 Tax=Monocercomonoides exilis TaxID=2049356 RepID=UPI00355A4CF2|nr:hypothetical protein MONOS_15184 [Monocercomonoides exilis]|eukprot:MONOS_15184.1-p1 / transcript=MONOS_15184.1 / gene=MONOS_15184 / organism=Monocercomonoides_exilis_PA203 / gene_product=unspecified product / transcript_product=unspecified product / location=Mono_scaffold01164:4064-5682(-) / protein_length=422 / sequence_SO=supercontig / SO=protein_coding / is_pseudo=false